MQTIEERLTALERTARFYRLATLLLILLIVVGGISAFGDGVQDIVRTRRLEIINKYGEVVGYFSTGPDGAGQLQTSYTTGKVCFLVTGVQDEEQGGIRLYDGAGRVQWKNP